MVKCSKLAQKEYKTMHDWMGEVIYLESYKRFKSFLENETHRILWDFEIQMDHSIPVRRPHQVLINKEKKKLPPRGSCRSSLLLSENDRKQRDRQILWPSRKTKRNCGTWGWQGYGLYLALGSDPKAWKKDHTNYSIVEISLDIQKSPGDLRKFCHLDSSERQPIKTSV